MSALSLRLPEPLKSQAVAHAKSCGLSLNALVAVALQAYLDQRLQGPHRADGAPATATGAATMQRGQRKPASIGQKGLRPTSDQVRFACARRVRPAGILGLDFFFEFRRFVSWHCTRSPDASRWYRESDPRRLEVRA